MANSQRQKQILKTMGIPVWTAHRAIVGQKAGQENSALETVLSASLPLSSGNSSDSSSENIAENLTQTTANTPSAHWLQLQNEVANCTACEIHKTRTIPVLGVGNKQAKLFIVGDAPDKDEDIKGAPFLGNAGEILTKMLFAIGFSREDVFIVNAIKCYAPDDRKPLKTELETCSDYLLQQINFIKPQAILCFGAISAKSLLGSNETIGKLRGQVRTHPQTSIPLVATYHPNYLTRKPTEKRAVWNDLLLLKSILQSKE